MVTATLDGMAAGGFYDVVGGGFHRYSVDDRWLVPHFEKMLYDNAVLTSTYLHAWVVTARERYREVARRRLATYFASWRYPKEASRRPTTRHGRRRGADLHVDAEEADEVGLAPELLEPFEHGRYVVRGELSRSFGERVLAVRDTRTQPFRDDKALASWNGLALAALAEAKASGFFEARRLARRGSPAR